MRLAPFLLSVPFTLMAVGHAAIAAEPVATGAQSSETAAADSLPLSILWPVPAPKTDQTAYAETAAARQRITENQQPDYVLRTGTVMLDTPALAKENAAMFASDARAQSAARKQAAPRSRLQLGFFPDMQVEVEVTSDNTPAPGVRAINARELNHEFSTFSMTVADGRFLITFADPDSSMLYRVVGDSATGYGKVTQIDQALMAPVIYLPPLIPGEPQ